MINHTGGTRAPSPLGPTNLLQTDQRYTQSKMTKSPNQRGRPTHTKWDTKPTVKTQGFFLEASDATGEVTIKYPDGWLYVWEQITSYQLYNLLYLPNPKHQSPPIGQDYLWTDYEHSKWALQHITSKRAFKILGTPVSTTHSFAPANFHVLWTSAPGWTKLVWSESDNYSPPSNTIFFPPNGYTSNSANAKVNTFELAEQIHFGMVGTASYNGPAVSGHFAGTLATTWPGTQFNAFYTNFVAGAGVNLTYDVLVSGPGSFNSPFTIADTGGIPITVQIELFLNRSSLPPTNVTGQFWVKLSL
jgi:hypothetical protein